MGNVKKKPCASGVGGDGGGLCGSEVGVRYYVMGWRCPLHTPAAVNGRPETVPDPARTMEGIRAAAGLPPLGTRDHPDAHRAPRAPAFDPDKLVGQARRVYDAMKDGRWHTFPELAAATGDQMTTGVQARLREFRSDKYGLTVDAEKTSQRGVWRYRLRLPAQVG